MKKVFSVLLAISMVMVTLCACSKGESEKNYMNRITHDTHYSSLGESTVRAYEKLCTAVLNGETQVKFNTQIFDDVNQMFFTSFPLNTLVESIKLISDNSGIELTYKNDIDAHKKLIDDFYSKVDEILNSCDYKNVSKDRLIFNIYTYITNHFQIDNSVLSVYDTIITGKGAPSCINSCFEYLILSAGGEASHIMNSIGKGAIASYVKLGSINYYFDAAKEIETSGGKALKYFAMNDERASQYVTGPFKFTDKTAVDPVLNDTYSYLQNSVSYTVEGDNITVVCEDESVELNIG